MTVFIALVRAVNVGGTSKLPMAELKEICVQLGYENVQTYIASGNVLFKSNESAAKIRKALEEAISKYLGKSTTVFAKTLAEMKEILENNPFPAQPGNQVYAIFLENAFKGDILTDVLHEGDEEIVLGKKVIYVYYSEGMGKSKLVLPAAKSGTARNMNTVAKLVELGTELTQTPTWVQ